MIYVTLTYVFVVSLVAVVREAKLDQWGEDKSDKIEDGVALAMLTFCLCFLAWIVNKTNPLKVIAVVLGVRVLVFDYLVSYLLIKNKIIVGHWFTVTGKTARWDRLVARIHPWLRFVARLVLFALALTLFLSSR
jgi:hypothetical protein